MAAPAREDGNEPQPATCCGQGGSWARQGGPRLPGCLLCPRSPRYWRGNRRDGQPCQPVTLKQSYGWTRDGRTGTG
jgi:hypothetical protein